MKIHGTTPKQEKDKVLVAARIIHTALILAILSYANALSHVTKLGTIPVAVIDPRTLTLLQLTLAVLALLNLSVLPLLAKAIGKRQQTGPTRLQQTFLRTLVPWPTPYELSDDPKRRTALSISVFRAAVIEAVALYGLFLGLLGVPWQVVGLFFLTSAVGLIVTFPTRKRWQRWVESG